MMMNKYGILYKSNIEINELLENLFKNKEQFKRPSRLSSEECDGSHRAYVYKFQEHGLNLLFKLKYLFSYGFYYRS